MLSRHGSRYPTLGSNVQVLAENIAKAMDNGSFKGSGSLDFLNDWKYALGHEILVPKGRQELYDSGILHYYEYAQLYNPFSKIIARTTTQDRMLKVRSKLMCGFAILTSSRARSIFWLAFLDWNGQTMLLSKSLSNRRGSITVLQATIIAKMPSITGVRGELTQPMNGWTFTF